MGAMNNARRWSTLDWLILGAVLVLAAGWIQGCAREGFGQEPERPTPRLDSVSDPLGSKVAYRVWDKDRDDWSTTVSEGFIEEFSKETIPAGVDGIHRVPRKVKIDGVWQANPKHEATIAPPRIGLTLMFFDATKCIGEHKTDAIETWNARREVQRLLAASDAITVVWRSWDWERDDISAGPWMIETRGKE
jgi:hypothetical protein